MNYHNKITNYHNKLVNWSENERLMKGFSYSIVSMAGTEIIAAMRKQINLEVQHITNRLIQCL
jgi:hypothetical protein